MIKWEKSKSDEADILILSYLLDVLKFKKWIINNEAFIYKEKDIQSHLKRLEND